MRQADPGEGLDRGVRDAEEHTGGGAEHDAVVPLRAAAHVRAGDEEAAEAEQAALEGDHGGRRELRVRPVDGRLREPEEHERSGDQPQAKALTRPDFEAEEAIGHDRDQHHAGGEGDLDDRHRGNRQRGHVEAPAAQAISMPNANHFEE